MFLVKEHDLWVCSARGDDLYRYNIKAIRLKKHGTSSIMKAYRVFVMYPKTPTAVSAAVGVWDRFQNF